jgi:hypothetical protein
LFGLHAGEVSEFGAFFKGNCAEQKDLRCVPACAVGRARPFKSSGALGRVGRHTVFREERREPDRCLGRGQTLGINKHAWGNQPSLLAWSLSRTSCDASRNLRIRPDLDAIAELNRIYRLQSQKDWHLTIHWDIELIFPTKRFEEAPQTCFNLV